MARHKIRLIHNGVRLPEPRESRAHWRQRWGLGEQVPVVCMLANLSPHKDHATLIRAWRQVLADWPGGQAQPVLILAGRDYGQGAAIQALATESRLGEAVHLVGEVTDVAGLLRATDLCVFSSLREGLPNGVLEAMAAGLCAVGTDNPGMREAVGEAGVPLLVPPEDAPALAQAIRRVLDDGELRRREGTRNQRRIEEVFGVEQMCRRTVEAIREVLP